jgi:hypothetical protein
MRVSHAARRGNYSFEEDLETVWGESFTAPLLHPKAPFL